MLGSTSRLVLGMLGCMALLPSQVTADHVRYGRRHHHLATLAQGSPTGQTFVPEPSAASEVGSCGFDGATAEATTAYASATTYAYASASASAYVSASASASASVSAVSFSNTTAKVIIPFYVYPNPGAWTPMEELVASYPNVHFTIIINPDSGPGSTTLPDANFLSAVPKLTSYSNVLAIGYVPTQKGTRAIADVEKDIKTYANWPTASGNSTFAVRGIFLDEAPNAYSAELVSYYQQLATLIKGSDGLGPENYVVTNPGTVPDSAYLTIPDSTVVFESPYDSFMSAVSANTFASLNGTNHSTMASMVYSVPDSVHLPTLIGQVGTISDQIFLGNTSTYDVYSTYMNEVVSFLATA